jgi:hypothetical protein
MASTKSEYRNSKQFQNDERQNKYNVPNRRDRNRRFEFSEFGINLAAVCFGFGASDFGFSFSQFVSVRGASFDIRIADFLSPVFWRDKLSLSRSVEHLKGENSSLIKGRI